MLAGTPPDSYPAIRLPIKGVRGACGSVYHKHGVFYEGVGSDVYHSNDHHEKGFDTGAFTPHWRTRSQQPSETNCARAMLGYRERERER